MPHWSLTAQTGSAVTAFLSPGILGPNGFLLLMGGCHHQLTPDLMLSLPQSFLFNTHHSALAPPQPFVFRESPLIPTNEDTCLKGEEGGEDRW